MTYSSTGIASDKAIFICVLLSKEQPDVLFLQKTCPIQSTLHKLDDIHDDYLWDRVCGMDESHLLFYLGGELMCNHIM